MSFKEVKLHGSEDFPFGLYLIDENHPKYEMAFHWHTNAEMIRVKSGSLEITLNNKKRTAKSGDVVFINSEVVHGATPSNCVYECLVFPLSYLKSGNRFSNSFIDNLVDKNCHLSSFPEGEEIKSISDRLFETVKEKKNGYQFVTIGLVNELIGEFLRTNQYSYETEGLEGADDRKVLKLKNTLSFIRNNFDKEITLDDMAYASGFSTKYFCSFFKEMTGKTPVSYLNSYRVERACRKLLGSDLTITQIAYGCGFNDLSYFIKTFKEIKKCTPKYYRANIE